MPDLWDELSMVLSWDAFVVFGATVTAQTRRRSGVLSLVLVQLNETAALQEDESGETARAALRDIAVTLVRVSRRSDMVGRHGPLGFAVLAHGAQQGGSVRLVQRIREALPRRVTTRGSPVSLSISVAMATLPQDGETLLELVQNAEEGLATAAGAREATEAIDRRRSEQRRRRGPQFLRRLRERDDGEQGAAKRPPR